MNIIYTYSYCNTNSDVQCAGFLVRDFLITPDNIDVYAKRVAEEKDCYNGFSLTLIDLGYAILSSTVLFKFGRVHT